MSHPPLTIIFLPVLTFTVSNQNERFSQCSPRMRENSEPGKTLHWEIWPFKVTFPAKQSLSFFRFTGHGSLPCSCGFIDQLSCVCRPLMHLAKTNFPAGDMTTDGPYFSQFLLIVLCAHAARFHNRQVGDMLISRARLLLGTEIHRPSSIPTVQALLQLSARDLAFGSISQAWLYSGMAFRMVSDLGLHQSTAKMVELGHFSSEDLEIRRRLFWSCYFWDKYGLNSENVFIRSLLPGLSVFTLVECQLSRNYHSTLHQN